ncbi:MAG: hypothetical protein ACOY0T_30375 [Myxococcota bacterium]
MSNSTAPSEANHDESEVPPAVSCVVCGRADCSGCEAQPAPTGPGIAWEGRGASMAQRLWSTALSSSLEPARTFGALPDGAVAPALGFALLAELIAIGSFAVLVVLLGLAVAPRLSLNVLTRPLGVGYVLAAVVAASVTMVALHALWGACLEWGARAKEPHGLRQSVRFALYACGWDLLTSPAGLLQGLTQRGFPAGFAALVGAVRAPRPALRAYQDERRRFEREAQRRAMQLSLAVLTATLLALLPIMGWALIAFAEWAFAL